MPRVIVVPAFAQRFSAAWPLPGPIRVPRRFGKRPGQAELAKPEDRSQRMLLERTPQTATKNRLILFSMCFSPDQFSSFRLLHGPRKAILLSYILRSEVLRCSTKPKHILCGPLSGRSQHVTIPQAYWFGSNVVSIRRDPESGDLILSEMKPLAEVFVALDSAPFPERLLSEADRDRRPPHARPAVDAIQAETWRSLAENQVQLDCYCFTGSNSG